MTCPTPEALSRAALEGPTPALTEHLAACDACQRTWDADVRIRDAARQLPWSPIDPTRGESALVEAALFERKAQRRSALVRTRIAVLGAVAAAFIAVMATRETKPAAIEAHATREEKRATIRDARGARFAHVTKPATKDVAHDEIVELQEGTIALDVAKLEVGQRFRVVTPDAEVEVRGTSFEVVVEKEKLARVAVISGRVIVRPRGLPERVLEKGDTWTRSEHETTPAERLFTAGFDAIRAGDLAQAEQSLAQLAKDHPTDALAEDAQYWRAVIAQRADRKEDARTLWRALRTDHPTSPRASEAAVMLGWLELERGDKAEAARLFQEGASSNDDTIQQSARAGLERAGD